MAEKLTYTLADDVKTIADELIPQFHNHLLQLDVPILYVFRSKPFSQPNTLAVAKRVGGAMATFLSKDFIAKHDPRFEDIDEIPFILMVEVVAEYWWKMDSATRIALVDHELSHFDTDGSIKSHDLEEFRSIIERHGYWKPDIEAFADAVKAVEAAKPMVEVEYVDQVTSSEVIPA